jgi:hypothetical protein
MSEYAMHASALVRTVIIDENLFWRLAITVVCDSPIGRKLTVSG